MPRKKRRPVKSREKRLERVPEKLQRRRERRVSYRLRRMPAWIKVTLVIAVITLIVVGSVLAILPIIPKEEPEPVKGDVYFLQEDRFFCNVTSDNRFLVDYMEALFGVGTRGGEQNLHIIVHDTFQDERNITIRDPVVWDYYGNAYLLNFSIEPKGITFNVGEIPPIDVERRLDGNARGYWSLYFGYLLESSHDKIVNDPLDDLLTFNCTIKPLTENGTLIYGNVTQVTCTLLLTAGIEYSAGRARIEFPTKIYDENGTLLAELKIHKVREGTYTEEEDAIRFTAPEFTFLGVNDTYGFDFDLNVTTYTNDTFCLLDFTTEQCEFYVQAGYLEGYTEDQPMHFPKATADIRTPYESKHLANYTDIYIQLPQVWVNVSAPPTNTTPPSPSNPSKVPRLKHLPPQLKRLFHPSLALDSDEAPPLAEGFHRFSSPHLDHPADSFHSIQQPLYLVEVPRRLNRFSPNHMGFATLDHHVLDTRL